LPTYLDVEKEISDVPEYQPIALARKPLILDEEKKASSGDEK
jgi:hypothetical protein